MLNNYSKETLTDRQKEVIHSVNKQKEDGVLRIVSGETKSVTNPSKMELRAVLSSETVDRYSDVILASAFNTPKNFKNYFDSNNILLWAHGRDSSVPNLPLGTVKDPSFDGLDHNGNKAFEGTVVFTDAHQHAINVWKLYEKGVLKAFSVGFRPITISKEPVKDGQTGITFKEVDLLENSAVPIPANSAALRKAFLDGDVSEEFLEGTFFKMRDEILVRNSDIFLPTNWKFRESINELAILAADISSGYFRPYEKAVPTKKEPDFSYECEYCSKSSMVNLEDFPEKDFMDIKFRDVVCEHCKATQMQCLDYLNLLLSQKQRS